MADIVLAECAGQAWLVRGEQYIDDLLTNTMDPQLTTEVITCESKSGVDDLWRLWNDSEPHNAWMIHPNIVNRVRAQSGELAVTFAAWSAAMDEMAQRAVQYAADLVNAKPGATLALVRLVPDDAAPMAAQMAELRCSLLEAQLTSLGVARTTRASRVANAVRMAIASC